MSNHANLCISLFIYILYTLFIVYFMYEHPSTVLTSKPSLSTIQSYCWVLTTPSEKCIKRRYLKFWSTCVNMHVKTFLDMSHNVVCTIYIWNVLKQEYQSTYVRSRSKLARDVRTCLLIYLISIPMLRCLESIAMRMVFPMYTRFHACTIYFIESDMHSLPILGEKAVVSCVDMHNYN